MVFRISVVITTYNGAPWIARALQSVLEQERVAPMQVVVVDDCSSDDTVDVVHALGDARVEVIALKRNVGVAAARNVGVEACRGDWVGFNDQDDVWLPDKLALQTDLLAAYPRADAAVGGIARLAADGRSRWAAGSGPLRWSPQNVPRLRTPPWFSSDVDGSVYLQTVLVRRAMLQRIGGFKPDLPLADDSDLIQRVSEAGVIVCVERPLFLYRLGNHNQTAPGVARANTFLAARSYVRHAAACRRAGAPDPDAAAYMRAYRPSPQELKQFMVNQEFRLINTLWVNVGLWAALRRFFAHSLFQRGALHYVTAALRRRLA
jgi:glycosyltransferase involved in cell wall biosynthesis